MNPTQLVIITGMSGAGKSTAVRCFEELGYFTVDNMPPSLLPTFVELCAARTPPIRHVAAVVDVRGGSFFDDVRSALDALELSGTPYQVLFLDSTTDELVKRFKEHRLEHPLHAGSLTESIARERELLTELKAAAGVVLDTSTTSVRQLRGELMNLFPVDGESEQRTVQVLSFGFKYGMPPDVDYIFDVRYLRNPHHDPELRPLTGDDPRVAAYIDQDPRTAELARRLGEFCDFVLPAHWDEGRRYVSLGIGCTGGKHRSVVLANRLGEHCETAGYRVVLQHRDRDRE